jgi:predicted enzyme involved in methoxymalonyl-ACP biosynthesis
MGRRVEEAIVWAAVERARTMGGETLVVEPIATPKNKPCRDFWTVSPLRSTKEDPVTYEWPVREIFPAPSTLVVAGLTRE